MCERERYVERQGEKEKEKERKREREREREREGGRDGGAHVRPRALSDYNNECSRSLIHSRLSQATGHKPFLSLPGKRVECSPRNTYTRYTYIHIYIYIYIYVYDIQI